ncbi:NAD-dependent epimerase/dehydratase family protein [Bacillus sp. BP-3]|uniref:NAD-dependent epimerase/dehydratase family protein n=1 Tax=Bacillus sp. BP-3 TaxID=3022773 RepID=UPI0023310C60|nr:NAD-dependent epimerase/dehydratase family protein [Bacillus sp. BP-3]MDC2863956.1 hypothetical protein [Bacillus sp. BP-3]
MLKNIIPIVYCDGKQTRDFIFVKDVVHVNFLAPTNADSQVCNISSNQRTSVNKLISVICSLMKKRDTNI